MKILALSRTSVDGSAGSSAMAFVPNSLRKRAEEQVVEEQLLGTVCPAAAVMGGSFISLKERQCMGLL